MMSSNGQILMRPMSNAFKYCVPWANASSMRTPRGGSILWHVTRQGLHNVQVNDAVCGAVVFCF